jgi:hypothetical protein
LREERKLRGFENMMLRRIFGPKRDEATGVLRKLHNEDLFAKYCSGDQIEKNDMDRACSTYREEERCI